MEENNITPEDTRDKLWSELESKIQQRAEHKDSNFVLSGPWKIFLRKEGELDIYKVEGEWIRTNLSVVFGHGGHGYVHEFIPNGEIWVDVKHHADCVCKNVAPDRKMSEPYTESTILHESTEYREMKKGKSFWVAHNIALATELEAGILKDPYSEVSSED